MIFKVIKRIRAVKSQEAATDRIFVSKPHPLSSDPEVTELPCAPHSQAGIQRVKCGTWMLKIPPSLGVCWSADISVERDAPTPF